MKHLQTTSLLICFSLWLAVSCAQASMVVTLDNLGFTSSAVGSSTVTSNGVTGSVSVSSGANNQPTRNSNYTVTGFDFDGNGVADGLTFTLTMAASGGNGTISNSGGFGVNGSGFGAINGNEALSISFASAAVTLNGSTTSTASASLIDFTGATTLGGFDNPLVSIDGSAGESVGSHMFTSLGPSFSTANAANNPRFRLRDVDLGINVMVFNAVPEPTTLAMSLLGFGLVCSRRRR